VTQKHEDRIRQRAYEIREREGCPDEQDLDHWLKAEREMILPEPLEATNQPRPTSRRKAKRERDE
jgi:hypothetical protein